MKSLKVLSVVILALFPSWIKIPYLRFRGAKIGKGSKISIFSFLWVDKLVIGNESKIGPFTMVRCRSMSLGNRVQIKPTVVIDTVSLVIGHDSIVMEQVVVGGMKTPRSSLIIGERVKIFPYSFINPTEPIVIEDEVGVGGANYIFTHGSWQSALDGYPISFGPVTIKKGVWLPWRVFILPNVEIGENCTIGANSVVNKSIPSNCLAAGAPAKVISSDGAYLQVKNESERLSFVIKILSEMFEQMRFEGSEVKVNSTTNGVLATIQHGNSSVIIEYTCDEYIDSERSQILISYFRIPEKVIKRLIMLNRSWLDLERRQCFFGHSLRVHEVRAFFGRYGIRFSVWGE